MPHWALCLIVFSKFRTMYANVLKFHIWIPHEKIGDPYFFLIQIISHFRVISLLINNIEISYICTVVTIMGKQCWSQAVLESRSWGHSILQTPALVTMYYLSRQAYGLGHSVLQTQFLVLG